MLRDYRSRRFPIGVQTFSQVRQDFEGYVDKTAHIHRLAHESGKYFFLSRPRRFGKSLLLSTMQAYFEGRRELFSDLAMEKLETEWESLPVIKLDLSTVKTRDASRLEPLLDSALRPAEDTYGRDPLDITPGSRLKSLIKRAHDQSGTQVVVLIDEYDAPLLNVVDDPARLEVFRGVMREFFAPLKACDEWLRLVFITGITKFSQLSIFSELNNLRDITMDPTYASICGITKEELFEQFSKDIDKLAAHLGITSEQAVNRLRGYYDGYHFAESSPDIYNPFSLLNAFAEGRIRAFWFNSGTPTFLIELLRRHEWDIAGLERCVAREESFDAPAERMTTPLPMLYQSGYLTIKHYDAVREAYVLGIPNEEVRQGLSKALVMHAAPEAFEQHFGFLDRFADHLRAGSMEDALQAMRSYLASIPYHLGSKDERGFQTTLYLVFDLLGIQIQTEFRTATGRVDAVVSTKDTIYVIEFKYDRSAEEALAQIDEKGYMLPFEADDRRLVKVGVNFSSQTRTIDRWIIEET